MMDKHSTDEKIEGKLENTWEVLWPKDEYRKPDERTEAASELKLWPRDGYRPEDQRAGHEVERLLYPRDELRPPDERAGHQIERHFWTWYKAS
jgi:hypothetical protein